METGPLYEASWTGPVRIALPPTDEQPVVTSRHSPTSPMAILLTNIDERLRWVQPRTGSSVTRSIPERPRQ